MAFNNIYNINMIRLAIFHKLYESEKNSLFSIIQNFTTQGIPFGNQNRNSIKLFNLQGNTINIKSFKIPNLINQISYNFFRKSKAQRSFEYACKLQDLNVGTPQPIAYFEFSTPFLFKNSYYISEHLHCDLTFRELTTDLNYPDHENIVRAFTRFTFELHEKGVHFLDHSPGNTLIKKNDNHYDFYLVDLNRMEFKTMDFKTRMVNFARLTKETTIIKIMANEYAKLANLPENVVFDAMMNAVLNFQHKFHRKKALKNKILFRK